MDVSEKRKISLPAGNGTTFPGKTSIFTITILTELFWIPSITKFKWIVSSQEDACEACELPNECEG